MAGIMSELSSGGIFVIQGVPGTELDSVTAASIRESQPGGFILFGRNIKSPEQLRKLIDDLRSLVHHEPIVTIDQEGGRVSRLKEIGSEPPSAKQLRDKGDLSLIARHGALTGQLLRHFGFNLDLCPVLDISFDDEADNSLKNRTYGRTPEEAIPNVRAFNDAMRAEGVLSCGKHFPGYSAAGVDPHHELPRINRTRAELEKTEWLPFRALLPQLDTMMMGHAVYPDLDDSLPPASLSKRVITDLLRNEWGYQGCVMTDDLDMGAMINYCDFATSVRRALEAGNDLMLLCHRTELIREAAKVLSELPSAVTDPARERVHALQKRLVPPDEFSLTKFKALDDQVMRLRIDTLGREAAAQRSTDDGKRSPVELF
ncbi:MAG: beta-N-acetylhexosaminidase [Verrucomicrobia bacterium Tous-C9LFEB]|nr:MAG: beta-N-acetylhexosaminidase [Verrucomicrobia bacterium Tous-C9LFEB]